LERAPNQTSGSPRGTHTKRAPYDLRSYGLRLDALWNETPTLETNCFANEISTIQFRFAVYRIRRRRLGTAGAKGLRGNEA